MENKQQQNESDSDDSFEGFKEFDDKAKEEEIQDHFNKNYEKAIQGFQGYCEQRNQMKQLLVNVSNFEQKIDKIKKSNMYDIKEINSKSNLIVNITKLQAQLMKVKNNMILAQKAISQIKIDKNTAAIRHFQKINYVNQSGSELLGAIHQIVIKKVQNEADKKIKFWVEELKSQQIQMGQVVLQNCEQMLNNNQQFGRISLFQPDTRSSIIMRPSLLNQPRASIIRQSVIKQSTVRLSNINQSQSRLSFFQQFNPTPTNARQSLLDQSLQLNSSLQQDILSEQSVWEFQIDFSSLKMPQLLYENLNQKIMFFQQLKQYRIQYLLYICTGEQKYLAQDLRNYLSGILGFILMDLELNKAYKEYEEINQIIAENYKLIEKQIKNTFLKSDLSELLIHKKELQNFSIALAKLKLYQLSNAINKSLNDQFIIYSNRRIENIKNILGNAINSDTGEPLSIESKETFDQLCQILKVKGSLNQRTKKYELPISKFAQEVVIQINNFIDGSIQYLQSLNEYFDQNVIFYIDTLFIQICDNFKIFVQSNEDFMLLTQTTLNFNYIENSITYYRKHIQNLLQVTTTKEFECISHFKNTRYFCEEAIQNAINTNLKIEQDDWNPNAPNKGPHDLFLIAIGHFESNLATLQLLVPDFVDSSIYLTFKQLNKLIWKSLFETKYFNILGLVNIEIDLKYLLNICGKQQYPESIKEFTQFISLFLYESSQNYLDANKRNTNFNYLNAQKLLKVLPKYKVQFNYYKKLNYGNYPQVRKRDIDTIVKKIQENPTIF